MKKWFSMISTPFLLAGSITLGATTDFGVIHILAMVSLVIGGIFMGLFAAK